MWFSWLVFIIRTQSEIISWEFGTVKVPVSISSFVFQAFVLIEFLLRNPYPVVCSRLLCQTGILVFFSSSFIVLWHTLSGKKKQKRKTVCAYICACVSGCLGRMVRRKCICVVKICTPKEVYGGMMGGVVNVLSLSCVESFMLSRLAWLMNLEFFLFFSLLKKSQSVGRICYKRDGECTGTQRERGNTKR